ncbi:hypothetical protein E2P81_ATG08749 [Venturia nashicola]|nr:hypothetical protein E2P81_ATG08749 [Venturia nashicola]
MKIQSFLLLSGTTLAMVPHSSEKSSEIGNIFLKPRDICLGYAVTPKLRVHAPRCIPAAKVWIADLS